MPLPNSPDNGFTVELNGSAPRGEDKDASQAALINFIREELVGVPTRIEGGNISTPQISDTGEITANGELDGIALQAAVERAVNKYIESVNHNLDRVFGK